MSKTLTLEQADALTTRDDRVWWETWGKTLVRFTPAKGEPFFKTNAYRNTKWRGANKWGTIKRIEVGADGLFRL